MKTFGLTLILLMAILSAGAGNPLVVELPRPNSGTFSSEQAEARKSELLSNTPTARLESWKNSYMGFCIHVGKDDSLTVYGHSMEGMPRYSGLRTRQSAADIKKLMNELPLAGNPAGVLITSDVPLKESKVIYEVLKVLFVPSVQIFYARRMEAFP